mmetsp:Transcript_7483/g.18345  ORF Transcript_7483/g.18345 Transcript_7483/m.18345 type:complete len:329 (-) Transcript_7483:158-1144(-)
MESSMSIQSSLPTASSKVISCMTGAQQLNNFATLYIETGNYDNAIVVLQEALRLWEDHRVGQVCSKTHMNWCSCSSCTLDGCIAFSEQQQQNLSKHKHHVDSRTCCRTRDDVVSISGNKRRRLSSEKSMTLKRLDTCEDAINTSLKHKNRFSNKTPPSRTDDSNHGYTYQNPIRIPRRHNMGSACFFIVLFNLTLANHLKVLNGSTEVRKDEVKGVLNLYELIFEYWSRLQADRSVEREDDATNSSLRFLMILFNNMSQMYRMVENVTKQQQCLENLLSMVMIAVECNARLTSIRQRGNDEDKIQRGESFQQSIEGFFNQCDATARVC